MPGLCTTKEGRHATCNSLTRAQSIDSLASQTMTNLTHKTDVPRTSMMPPRPGHAVLPMALILGVWFTFSAPSIMVAQAATPSEPMVERSTLADENAATDDDPDENLVPLDTEGPPPEALPPPATSTTRVPRAEDLLQLNPAGNSPSTARFSDALNPPAELSLTQDPSETPQARHHM